LVGGAVGWFAPLLNQIFCLPKSPTLFLLILPYCILQIVPPTEGIAWYFGSVRYAWAFFLKLATLTEQFSPTNMVEKAAAS
jgi:hypothetical protein